MAKKVVTRYAPSPTGYMHIGNLRTALYSYLVAKHNKGKFILRIEDTDKERQVEGAEQIIYDTLRIAKLNYDEGPDIGGPNGPYVQSERKDIYLRYALELIDKGYAYYCFCTKEELDKDRAFNPDASGYSRRCRNLSPDEVAQKLNKNMPYVIRLKADMEGATAFYDHIFGDISIPNSELNDIVLIKADGYPTYNFAHVIDDHLMGVTDVLRGNEYLSSTPLYVMIYKAFGWEVPQYYHLPLIMGKSETGEIGKLSKRHGSVSFSDLLTLGYLPQAIINYIALLGWHPSGSEQEFFSLDELVEIFDTADIRKSSAIFDYEKLKWMNSKYITALSLEEFSTVSRPYIEKVITKNLVDYDYMLSLVQPRIQILSEIPEKIEFFQELTDFDLNILANEKKKTTLASSVKIIEAAIPLLESVKEFDNNTLFTSLSALPEQIGEKAMSIMWVLRIGISGNPVTIGGATEIMQVLGKLETVNRLLETLNRLKNL